MTTKSTTKPQSALPRRSPAPNKTLLDQLSEQQADTYPPSLNHEPNSENNLATATLYALTLSTLHFTFDVLVHHQYAQELSWPLLFRRAFTYLPIFGTIVYLSRMDSVMRFQRVRRALLLLVSEALGAHLVRITNEGKYLAIMKRAPAVGVLWLWTVVEMDVRDAVGGLGVVMGFVWWKGYSLI